MAVVKLFRRLGKDDGRGRSGYLVKLPNGFERAVVYMPGSRVADGRYSACAWKCVELYLGQRKMCGGMMK